MTTCNRCASTRIANVNAKCNDNFVWISDTDEYDGYVKTPGGEFGYDSRSSGGDYLEFSYCLECGTIQSSFPCASSFDEDYMGGTGGSGE